MKTLLKYKILTCIITLVVIIFLIFFIFPDIYYDLKDKWIVQNHIEWSKNQNLEWKHFAIDDSEEPGYIYASLAMSIRYDTKDESIIKSRTLFNPLKSKIYDSLNANNLRLANAKFDLLEVYRRRMAKEIDSIFSNKIKGIPAEYYPALNDKYYNEFQSYWSSFINNEEEDWALYELEYWIDTELQKKK